MYIVVKTMEISASHRLSLDHDSPCQNIHGHNWHISIYCKSDKLDGNGMVIDFSEIKRLIHGQLDHKDLNTALGFNPTAENIAKWIVDTVPSAFKCKINESRDNMVIYEKC